jgi:hypothetical protein
MMDKSCRVRITIEPEEFLHISIVPDMLLSLSSGQAKTLIR